MNSSSTTAHAKRFAYELSWQGTNSVDRLTRSLFDACVDLNPHQIDAGLVLCQHWAGRRHRLLVICPAAIA